MKISVEWLQDYLEKKLTTQQMASALEQAGVEVEGIERAGAFDDGIVVGVVTDLSPHPNADKLRLAAVKIGDSEAHVVCGAPNLAKGQTVALAQVGAVLPDGTKLTQATIRGEESQGMICSEQELGISGDHNGIMVLPDDWKSGQKLSQYLQRNDVIEVKSHPNRWDLQSVIGLAREIAAQEHTMLRHKGHAQITDAPHQTLAVAPETEVQRYILWRLQIGKRESSPAWMTARLRAANIRPISLIVDVTNYVMLETGQPLHAFDAQKVSGAVQVRLATRGEKLVTLDGSERSLNVDDVVIADDSGAIGIGGVMGGRTTEIDEHTTEILLEAAIFDGGRLRKTSQRHGLRTDASARFERRLPVQSAAEGVSRAASLLEDLCEGEVIAVTDVALTIAEARSLSIHPTAISMLLGIEVSPDKLSESLGRLGFDVELLVSETEIVIRVPWWRPDVSMEADVAEEMIKAIGYDALPSTLPPFAARSIAFDATWAPLWRARGVLRSLGLFEVVTYSFVSEEQLSDAGLDQAKHLKLKNPLSSEQAYLRSSLIPSLLGVVICNRAYSKTFGVSELSKVYIPAGSGELPTEVLQLGLLIRRPNDAYRHAKAALDRLATEFNIDLTLKAKDVQPGHTHPMRSAEVFVGTRYVGYVAQLHPKWMKRRKLEGEVAHLTLDWQQIVDLASVRRYHPISKFPSIVRDVSFIVDRTTTWQEVRSSVKDHALLESIDFADDYYGDDLPTDKKSITIRLHFVSHERTLKDADVARELESVVGNITSSLGAARRD